MSRKAKYYIYRNLHKGDHFSVKYRGKVITRAENIRASNVEFIVSKKGRERALKENRRNVHAYAACASFTVLPTSHNYLVTPDSKVYYNPFKNESFMCGGKPITKSQAVLFLGGSCFAF